MKETVSTWRKRAQLLRMEGEVCPKGHNIFPPRDLCPDCNTEAYETKEFSGKGKIYSLTTVIDAPKGFEEQAPYPVALIELEEGPMVAAQLTDNDPNQEIGIGTPVEMVTRRLKEDGEKGVLVYGYKFRPVLERS